MAQRIISQALPAGCDSCQQELDELLVASAITD